MSYAYRHTDLCIPASRVWLDVLQSHVPDACALLIVFSTSPIARRESRDFVAAQIFHAARYATLLVSALTPYEEKRDPDAHFDVPRLTQRLVGVIDWARHQPPLASLPIGLLGTGTGAGAAIKASGGVPPPFALVSRAGRADLAGAEPLRRNTVPHLSIVGSDDNACRAPARRAHDLLEGDKAWVEIPDAGALFIEPGSLDAATRAALEWFERWRPEPQPALPPIDNEDDIEPDQGVRLYTPSVR